MKYLLVRKANNKDIERLIVLQKQMARYHHGLDSIWSSSVGGDDVLKKTITKLLRRGKDFLFLVLECDGRLVGYATAEIKNTSPVYAIKKLGHIGSVFVEKRYRKLGLATLAIEAFMSWFKENKITEVTLLVDVKNPLGVNAWKKLGFAEWRLVLRRKA